MVPDAEALRIGGTAYRVRGKPAVAVRDAADARAALDCEAGSAFLTGELVPHAEAEERVLYPAVADLLGAPEATAPMIHDHTAIRARIAELVEQLPPWSRLPECLDQHRGG